MRLTILLALLPTLALAQSPTLRSEDLGTVTGHIICADTRSPARLAQVQLIGIKTASKIDSIGPFSSVPGGYGPTHTDFTGSYILTGVAPGQYYLRVDLSGYATPIAQFTRAELNTPTPEIQPRIKSEPQLVTVTPNSTAQADAVIYRAASIVGTVLFDDGSPAIGIDIRLLRHTAMGKSGDWLQVGAVTDGHGQFDLGNSGDLPLALMMFYGEAQHRLRRKLEVGAPRLNTVVRWLHFDICKLHGESWHTRAFSGVPGSSPRNTIADRTSR